MANPESPTYSVQIVDDKTTYHVDPILTDLELSEQEGQMAQKAILTLMNIQISGKWATNVFRARQKVFIYADDGSGQKEVFRGWIWNKQYTSSNSKREFQMTCYDHMIYLQESEVYYYYPSGKSTEDILKNICNAWGVGLKYEYDSIKHEKLLLKGTLSNLIINNLLDPVRDKTGKRYVMRMEENTLHILEVGQNASYYQLNAAQNVTQTRSIETMEGMITRVVIFGKQGEGSRAPVEATVEDNVDTYGTLQRVYGRNEASSLEDAKKEATTLLNLSKWPFQDFEVQAPDIPWIRKGDLVYVNAGDIMDKYLTVKSVSRSISLKGGASMTLMLDNGVPREYTTNALASTIAQETPKTTDSTAAGGGTVYSSTDIYALVPGLSNEGPLSGGQQAVISAAYSTASPGADLCAMWVSLVFQNAGIGYMGGHAFQQVQNYCHYPVSALKPGMIIGATSCATGAGWTYGHVAVYVGNNTIRSPELGRVVTYDLQRFNAVYGTVTGLRCGWAMNRVLA
ncbi:MAG: hypothetical protein Q4C56_04090 [Peptococcaceae bacterium]|nr:hypothetical protein [Peptococcaceae bacterium]